MFFRIRIPTPVRSASLLCQRALEAIPSLSPIAAQLCYDSPCDLIFVCCSFFPAPYQGPYLRPSVSGNKASLCTQHPAAFPSPVSLCHSSGSSLSPLEHFHSPGSHSAASTNAKGGRERAQVTFRPEGQHRLEVITIDVLEHDPVVVFDLQRNTSYGTSESVLKSRRGAQLAIYSYQYRHNNDLAGWILF